MPDRISWGEDALRQALLPLLPGLQVEVVAQAGSTNSALIDRARGITLAAGGDASAGDITVRRSVESTAFGRRAIDLQPCLLVAENQLAGRGRQGRIWQSVAGASLTFSLALPLAVADLSGLSLAVGVAIADALDGPETANGETQSSPAQISPAQIAIKWPNDLWLVDASGTGRKLGGVLIETIAAGAQRLVVVGVGLNIRHFETSEVLTGFATLDERDPGVSAPAVLARIALPLVQALKRFEQGGLAGFLPRFEALDLLRGKEVTTTSPEAPRGIAIGVSAQGALLVRTAEGTLMPVASGEVSVRLAVAAT